MYVRKEAVLSSQIEGTQSSLNDLLAAEAKTLSPDRPKDVAEVLNDVRPKNHGLKRLAELPLSVRLIKEIHAELLRGVRGSQLTPGELRRSQNWIGPGGCTLAEAPFVPPPPDEVPVALSDLENFLHAPSDLPDLIQICLTHAQFETIHPFLDGIGRIGRLLIAFLLCQRQILLRPGLYLCHYFKRHRAGNHRQQAQPPLPLRAIHRPLRREPAMRPIPKSRKALPRGRLGRIPRDEAKVNVAFATGKSFSGG